MPLMICLQASSMLIGIGANSLFSIRLGEGRRNEVEKIMGHALTLLFLVPASVIIFSFVFLDQIIVLLGASEAIFTYAKTYTRIILYGGIFGAMGPGINHFIRSDGHPRTSMFTQILGALINIILDPIFIFGFGWGIAGAAWATIISQFISFVWVMFYFNSKWTSLRFRPRDMKPERALTLKIMAIGFAPCAMQLAMAFVNILLNHKLAFYGGDMAVTSMGIVYSILILIFMPIIGLNTGAQPIIGYNDGAKQYDRVIKTFKLSVFCATVFSAAGFLVVQIFPAFLIRFFTDAKGELMNMGIHVLRVSTVLLPTIGFQMFSSNYNQSIGKPMQGTILSLSRQVIFYIPLILILPLFFNLDGVLFAMPAADLGATALSLIVMLPEFPRLKTLQQENIR
jgi:putative MATE family efflux protein